MWWNISKFFLDIKFRIFLFLNDERIRRITFFSDKLEKIISLKNWNLRNKSPSKNFCKLFSNNNKISSKYIILEIFQNFGELLLSAINLGKLCYFKIIYFFVII